jgi:hypothetical protein
MDQNVDGKIIRRLRANGYDVKTAFEDGHSESVDTIIFEQANADGRVLVIHYPDMLAIAYRYQTEYRQFNGLIFAPQNTAKAGTYIKDIELIIGVYESEEMMSRVEILPIGGRCAQNIHTRRNVARKAIGVHSRIEFAWQRALRSRKVRSLVHR